MPDPHTFDQTTVHSDALHVIRSAESLDDSRVGITARRTDTHAAFLSLLSARDSVWDELECILADGTPAGQIYAALLLEQIDERRGRRAFEQLLDSKEDVTWLSGCAVTSQRVDELASRLLTGEPVINFTPRRITSAMREHLATRHIEEKRALKRIATLWLAVVATLLTLFMILRYLTGV